MNSLNFVIIGFLMVSQVAGQNLTRPSFSDHLGSAKKQFILNQYAVNHSAPILEKSFIHVVDSNEENDPNLLVELGYIGAQQLAFLGLSYLASRKKGAGPIIVTGFDLMMGVGGLLNIPGNGSTWEKIGYAALSAGFFAKSYYTLKGSEQASQKNQFWASYFSYNILIYSGYYLDSL